MRAVTPYVVIIMKMPGDRTVEDLDSGTYMKDSPKSGIYISISRINHGNAERPHF